MKPNRCARCGRVTFLPAVVIGTKPFGRVCARKAGLIEPKRRGRASDAERDSKTMDLFEGGGVGMTRIYIAGPMSGLPDLNYPAFNAMAERLRALSFEVENPAENPPPKCESWLGYMRMAVAQLATCDAVVMLPGWSKSKGACIEHQLAVGLGLEIVEAGNV